jgi:hypothetical protein
MKDDAQSESSFDAEPAFEPDKVSSGRGKKYATVNAKTNPIFTVPEIIYI